MKFLYFVAISFILVCKTINAQTIPDSEFHWVEDEQCYPQGICLQTFVKVEQDPVLTQFNSQEFNDLIGNLIDQLNLDENVGGIIKLKLLIAENQNLCVTRIGTKEIKLSEFHFNEITNMLSSIYKFKLGKQRNVEVNCLGILYINIAGGKMEEIKNVNFSIG